MIQNDKARISSSVRCRIAQVEEDTVRYDGLTWPNWFDEQGM